VATIVAPEKAPIEQPGLWDGIPLVDPKGLTGWNVTSKDFTNEDGVLVGRGRELNASIWKDRGLPQNFELRVETEDVKGFHFGWVARDHHVIFIHYYAQEIRLTDYNDDNQNIELAAAKKTYPHGKRSWRILAQNRSVQVFVDGELALEANNIDRDM
jgi:hypothetical protein